MIARRVEAYLSDAESADFDELACRAFAFQYRRSRPLRRLCRRQGVEPSAVENWRQIPTVPALAFKTLDLSTRRADEVFRSSGTTGRGRSVHRHGFADLYRATIDAAFPSFCLGSLRRPPMLSLIPERRQEPDSSLSFMIDHVLRRWGAADSLVAFGPRGVEAGKARSFLAARQRDGRPTLVLATAFALAELLQTLERRRLRFRLPAGSLVFETGGYKGRTRELADDELRSRLAERLDIRADAVVREYGMTELTSQFYTRVLAGGDPALFVPSHWTRVRILDAETLAEAPAGSVGLIGIFDLANLSSAVHLLTEDLGIAVADGFRLVGRAAGAELRGCSLTVEELQETVS